MIRLPFSGFASSISSASWRVTLKKQLQQREKANPTFVIRLLQQALKTLVVLLEVEVSSSRRDIVWAFGPVRGLSGEGKDGGRG